MANYLFGASYRNALRFLFAVCSSETPVDSRLSADAAVFEPRKQSDEGESAAAGEVNRYLYHVLCMG